MIDPKELMMGDLVIDGYTNRPMRIEVVNKMMGSGLYPIPLTAEILEKNGFKKGEDDATLITRTSEYYIELWMMPLCVGFYFQSYYDTNELRINIDYVHELQQALRLCGLNELADNFKI